MLDNVICVDIDINMYDPVNHDKNHLKITNQIFKNNDTTIYEGTYGKMKCIVKQILIDCEYGIPAKVLKELAVLRKIKHENIVKLYNVKVGSIIEGTNEYFYNESHIDSILLILEQGVSSLINLDGAHLKNVKKIIENISCGLKHIHDNGYVHGDLSLGNIVGFVEIPQKKITFKIIDFGCATKNYRKSVAPIPTYHVAPIEILNEDIRNIDLEKIDSWALGCISYYISTGELLFGNGGRCAMRANILSTICKKNNSSITNILHKKINDTSIVKNITKLINLNTNKRQSVSQFYNNIFEKKIPCENDKFLYDQNFNDAPYNHDTIVSDSVRTKLIQLFLTYNIKNNIPIENIFLTFKLLYKRDTCTDNKYITYAIILYSLATKIVSFVEIPLVEVINLIEEFTGTIISRSDLLYKMISIVESSNWDIDTETLMSHAQNINNKNKMNYLIISLLLVCDKKYDTFSVEYLYKAILLLLNCIDNKKAIYVENICLISDLLNNIANSIQRLNIKSSQERCLILEYLNCFSSGHLIDKLTHIDPMRIKQCLQIF